MPRTLSDEHKAALHEGRARKAAEDKERRDAAKKAVFDRFSAWSERDARLYRQYVNGDMSYEEYRARKVPMPPIPTTSEEES